MEHPLLELKSVSKHYPGVMALGDVSLTVRAAEVHVLFGENGAGKSTLISLVTGAQKPSSGTISFMGAPIVLDSVRDARKLGISAVFQEFSLVPTMTVAENLFLGEEAKPYALLSRKQQRRRALSLLEQIGFDIDVDRLVDDLTRAEQQMIEIAKALYADARLLILDEPTASLSDRETTCLFDLVTRLKARGVGIIYITHRMQEIRRIGDRITVLRDGSYVATVDAKTTPDEELIALMAGRGISEIFPKIAYAPSDILLEFDRVSTVSGVKGASICVRRGEVVGLAGLVGCGKSEIMRAAFGVEKVTAGQIHFLGNDITGATPKAMLKAGLFYLPSDRKTEGLIMSFSSRENMTLSALRSKEHRTKTGWLSGKAERRTAHRLAGRVGLAERNVVRPVMQLSGGNQQKVVFGKGLAQERALFILDEPTVGVDVGTRSTLYTLIKSLTESGAGVVIISSDLPEVLNLSHRVYVMRLGQVAAEFSGDDIQESAVLSQFFERHEKSESMS
jgi:ribose transport system ATP-binding protein